MTLNKFNFCVYYVSVEYVNFWTKKNYWSELAQKLNGLSVTMHIESI